MNFKTNPVGVINVSSPYGYRTHPITKLKELHNGADLRPNVAGRDGDELYAVADGVISINKVNEGGVRVGYGYYIVIQHNGFATLYGHMQELSTRSVGTPVKAGEIVGYMGTTGTSTGTHLHFGLCKGDYMKQYGRVEWIDPLPYFVKTIADKDKVEIQKHIGYSNPYDVFRLLDQHKYATDLYHKWAKSYK